MTLSEAIKRAEGFSSSKIATMLDCGDRWAITFEDDYPKPCPVFDENLPEFVKEVITAPDVVHTFMFKDDGRFEYFCVGEYLDLLERSVKVELIKEAP